MSKMCYRFTMEEARKHFFRDYGWYKIQPTKLHLYKFWVSWVELQFAKTHEKRYKFDDK